MATGRYLVGRVLGLILTVVVVSVLVFVLMHAVPGGPFDESKSPLPPAAKANILRKYGLDQPIWVQYGRYMWSALHGDFGVSYQSPTETVASLIARVWPVTMTLGFIVISLSFGVGMLLGIAAAGNVNSWLDNLLTFVASLGITIPNFIVAIWLIVLFSARLHWLPTGGWGESRDLIMPVVAYSLLPIATIARYTRVAVLEALDGEYVRTARAKGLPSTGVMIRHVLPNALIPIVTLLGPWIPELLTGSMFIEVIFRIPGLGRYFATSVFQRDYPMIMAIMLLVAFLWGLTYLSSDLLYLAIDPRIRIGTHE